MSIKMQYCPKCGTKLEGSMTYNFCPHCGANFSEMNAEPSETVVVEPSEPVVVEPSELVVVESSEPVVVESSEPVVVESNTNKNNDDNEESDSSKSSKKIFIVAAIILLIIISKISINSINKQLEPKYDVINLTNENYKQYLQVYTENVVLVPRNSYSSKYTLSLVIQSRDDSYIFDNVTVGVHASYVSFVTSDYFKLTTSGFVKVSCEVSDSAFGNAHLRDPYGLVFSINGTVQVPRK